MTGIQESMERSISRIPSDGWNDAGSAPESRLHPEFRCRDRGGGRAPPALATTARIMPDVSYGSPPRERMDILLPPNTGPGAALHLFIHGGGCRPASIPDPGGPSPGGKTRQPLLPASLGTAALLEEGGASLELRCKAGLDHLTVVQALVIRQHRWAAAWGPSGHQPKAS